jgi:endonuclease-3 related protein
MNKINKSHSKLLIHIYNELYKHFGPQHWWPGDTPFEIAVGAILTQNTNWGNVEKAIGNLKRERLLNCRALYKLHSKKLASLIKPSGYFNLKTKRLKNFVSYLSEKYGGSMARMMKKEMNILRRELLDINGIGPETADSILLYALNKPSFVIDAYTKRVLQRHGIVKEKITYHEMQELFHDSFPADTALYNEYHALLVMTGKEFCRPKPRCEGCPLQPLLPAKGLCL